MMQTIVLTGGIDAEPQAAEAGGQTWQRAPGETLAVFRARVEAEAQAAGAAVVVIGGLPL